MLDPFSTHAKVIRIIHELRAEPFAIADISRKVDVSTSSVIRVLRHLKANGLIIYNTRRAYKSKQYHVASNWPRDAKVVIENFELTKILDRAS